MSRIAFIAEVKPLATNAAYEPARWGRRHGFKLTDEAKAYKAALAAACPVVGLLQGEVSVWIRFVFMDRRPDIDGPIKLVLDSLQGRALRNDRQVADLRVVRAVDPERPRVEIVVEELAPSCKPHSDNPLNGHGRESRAAGTPSVAGLARGAEMGSTTPARVAPKAGILSQSRADFASVLRPSKRVELARSKGRLVPSVRRYRATEEET